MIVIATIPLLFAIAGALVYALSKNARLSQLGLATFTAAMVALMIALSAHRVTL